MREQKTLAEDRAAPSSSAGGGERATSRAAGARAAGPEELGDQDGEETPGGGHPARVDAADGDDPGESVGDEEEAAARVPEDVGDGRDDDVVARQLREAAMSEEDPELREKLWEEYREYKRSAGR